jgi:hypothetical protein
LKQALFVPGDQFSYRHIAASEEDLDGYNSDTKTDHRRCWLAIGDPSIRQRIPEEETQILSDINGRIDLGDLGE